MFSLPQSIPIQVKHEQVAMSRAFASSSQEPFGIPYRAAGPHSYSEESADPEKYVNLASNTAEQAKLEHRLQLKNTQRAKEQEADRKGEPLSAKDKERERSRRESAVTRKRAEVYIQELEKTVRRVPMLEKEISSLRREISQMRQAIEQAQQQQQVQQSPQLPSHPVASVMTAVPGPDVVKSEPGPVLSPTTKTTGVVSGIKQLDL